MAKSVFTSSKLLSSHVALLLKTQMNDAARVDLAKYLHSRVCDKHNFYKVYKEFSFSSAKKEVMDYVAANP